MQLRLMLRNYVSKSKHKWLIYFLLGLPVFLPFLIVLI